MVGCAAVAPKVADSLLVAALQVDVVADARIYLVAFESRGYWETVHFNRYCVAFPEVTERVGDDDPVVSLGGYFERAFGRAVAPEEGVAVAEPRVPDDGVARADGGVAEL